MDTTHRMRRSALFGAPLRNLPIVLTALLIVMAAVDVLLVVQPSPVRALRDDWQRWVRGAVEAPWATLVGASAIIACLAVAAALLTGVVRGISEAPYLWVASALVAGCGYFISRMAIEVPVRMPTPYFAGLSALLLLGGGAFFQGRSFLTHAVGTFLTSVPIALLGVGYWRAHTNGSGPAFDADARTLLSVLALATIGTPLIAVAARRLSAIGRDGHGQAADRMVELIDRARTSERRAREAERELQRVTREGGSAAPRLREDDDLSLLRRSRSSHAGTWIVLVLAAGGALFGYFSGVRPIQQQLLAEKRFNREQTKLHAVALAKLQADFERERRELRGEAAAVDSAAAGGAASTTAQEAGADAASMLADPAPAAAASGSAKRKTARASEPMPPAPLGTEHETKPAAAPKASPQAAKAARPPEDRSLGTNTDDPIGGLEGL